MKILAATKTPYSVTNYIVQISSDELRALTTFEPYGKIPVTKSDGASSDRDPKELEAGDEIIPEFSKQVLDDVRTVLDERKDIHKAFGQVRASMTKLQARMPLTP